GRVGCVEAAADHVVRERARLLHSLEDLSELFLPQAPDLTVGECRIAHDVREDGERVGKLCGRRRDRCLDRVPGDVGVELHSEELEVPGELVAVALVRPGMQCTGRELREAAATRGLRCGTRIDHDVCTHDRHAPVACMHDTHAVAQCCAVYVR